MNDFIENFGLYQMNHCLNEYPGFSFELIFGFNLAQFIEKRYVSAPQICTAFEHQKCKRAWFTL